MQLPISIRGVAPGDGFVLLTGTRSDGLPDGVHTGGAWQSPDGREVWKPLDGRPFANADFHITTLEADVLELMAGRPGFPRNWRIEIARGRRFLVRPHVGVLGAGQWRDISGEHVLLIEQAVRALNAEYWEVNDAISVGFDEASGEPFILDLSAAMQIKNACDWLCADDWTRLERWMRGLGFDRLADLRWSAKAAVTHNHFNDDWPGREWRHVYASRSRPISSLWASIPRAHYVDGDYGKTGVFTWVVTPEPLSADVLYRYELAWGWSPIPYRDN